jgi:hypothetical protein
MALPHRTHLETLEKQLSNECTPVERARAAVQLLDALVRMQQVPGHALDALRLFFARDCSCCCTAPSFFPMIWARVVALKNSQLCSAAGEALFGICVGLHSNPVHVRILALKTLALFLRNAKPILPFTFLSWLNQQAKRTDLLSCSVGMFAVLFLMLGLESYDGAQAILSACLSKCTSNDELFLISCIAVRMLAAGISLVPFETWFDLVQDSFLNYTIDSISSSLLNDLKNLESLVILDEAPELSSGLALMFARERIPESLKTQIHHAFWSCCLTQFFVSRKIYFEFQKQAVPAAWKKFWGTLFYSVIRFLGMTSLDRFVLASPQILALRLDCVSLLQVGRSRHKQYSVVLTEFARRSETAVAMIELYLSSFSRLSVPDYVEKRLQTMIGSDLRVLKETALGSFDFPFLSREFFLLGLYTLWVNGQDLKPTLLKGPIRELSLITIVSDSKTTQRRSHGLYQALVRRDFGLVEDSVPFFIQACLEVTLLPRESELFLEYSWTLRFSQLCQKFCCNRSIISQRRSIAFVCFG